MSENTNISGLDFVSEHGGLGIVKKAGLTLLGLGLLLIFVAALGKGSTSPRLFLILSFTSITAGTLLYTIKNSLDTPPGIRNNFLTTSGITARGAVGWTLAVIFTGFYILLYWFSHVLLHLIRMLDPLSFALRDKPADQWFLYGTFYTLAVLLMGARAILKYRHNKYQTIRTCSVMFFQLIFGYLIPSLMVYFNNPEYYFTYFWPLLYKALFPKTLLSLWNTPGALGIFLCVWGGVMTFIATPILTYYFGKRWYCSWVCGCGALANTLGDPWRQLSNTSRRAWKIERKSIYSVLLFIIVTTALLWLNSFFGGKILGAFSMTFARVYGFLVGMVLAGVVGVGFYPLLGTRVWCRFACPMAAILGILQKKFSRFRITTNGAQCISCGNCSKYCEMGIDVRWYAQQQENIVRASCVGCGMCSAVCPRGVLNLENGPRKKR